MAIEVLQEEKDIIDFASFLYEQGYIITQRDGIRKNIVLSLSQAINSLLFDLYTSGGTYYIGSRFSIDLVAFDSCGRQSHPLKMDTQGRFAGKFSLGANRTEDARKLYNMIRRYIKRHYVYKQYNYCTNMCCFFGPGYLELENKLRAANLPKTTCQGFLHLLCHESDKEIFDARIRKELDNYCGIFTEVPNVEWKIHWGDKNYQEMNLPFQYDSLKIEKDECLQIASQIMGNVHTFEIIQTSVYLHISKEVIDGNEFGFLLIWELPWSDQSL